MTKILDGKMLSQSIAAKLRQAIKKRGKIPTLAIIQVGDVRASTAFINRKKAFGEQIGARVLHRQFPARATERQVLDVIKNYNEDRTVHGIIVQLPLPSHLDKTRIIEAIDPQKDVDGLTSANMKLLLEGKPGIVPATTRGILTLLDHYHLPLAGKRVVIIGRSTLVGKPTAIAFLNHHATVTLCHRQTRNLAQITKTADILIVAAGHAKLITPRHVSPKQIIIDVGINPQTKGVIGDVDPRVRTLVRAISPVPSGVGPMTIASLFQNLVENY